MKVKKPVKKAANGIGPVPKRKIGKDSMYTEMGNVVSKKDQEAWNKKATANLNAQYKTRPKELQAPNIYGNAPKPAVSKKKMAVKKALNDIGNKQIKNKYTKAENGLPSDSLKAKMNTELGSRKYTVDTSGYAAGKKKFSGTVSSGKGKSAPVKMGRVAVSKLMSPGGRKRSSSSK